MKTNFKTALLLTSVLAGVGVSTAAFAQDEITVTATRSERNIQDVPIAVTVNSGEELETKGVANIENIAAVSPSIAYQQTNNSFASAGILIRGIGTIGNNRAFEGSTGVFVDGVYRSRPGQVLQTFLDVDSVQVLRGPQGTLFGKNTTAGAFLLDGKKPDFDGFGGFYNASVGNFDAYRVQAGVNVPLSDTLAVRVAASKDDREGEWTNLFDGSDHGGGGGASIKASALWEPTENASYLLIADYGNFDRTCCYATADTVVGAAAAISTALLDVSLGGNGTGGNVQAIDTFDRNVYLNGTNSEEQTDQGITFKPTFSNVLGGELSGIFAYREWESAQIDFDADFGGADNFRLNESFESEQLSAELIYTRDVNDRFNFLVGGFYSEEEIAIDRRLVNGIHTGAFFGALVPAATQGLVTSGGLSGAPDTTITREEMGGDNESLGIFARAEFDVTDQFSVFGGIRYSEDSKDGFHALVETPDDIAAFAGFAGPLQAGLDAVDAGDFATAGPLLAAADTAAAGLNPFTILGIIPSPNNGYEETFEDDALSYSVGGSYALSPDVNLYASYNRGYKAGGIDLDISATGGSAEAVAVAFLGAEQNSASFESETTDSFELGAKVNWLDGRATTNVALFHTEIEDLQVAQFLGLFFAIENFSGATVNGLEIEHSQDLNDYLSIGGGLTYLNEASIDDDPALLAVPGSAHLSGRDLTRTPELAGNFSVNGNYPVSPDLSLFGRAALQYTDDHLTTSAISSDAQNTQDAYTLFDANFGVNFEEKGLSVEAFCLNCLDEEYVSAHFSQPLVNSAASPDVNAYLGKPRTYGIKLRGEF